MPSPEQVKDALENISDSKERELANFILNGNSIPRALPADRDDVQFQAFLDKWRQNENIGGLDIKFLNGAQNDRISLIQGEIDLRSLNSIQRTFQRTFEPPSQQPAPNTRRSSITHLYKDKAQSKSSTEQITVKPAFNDVLDTTKEDVMRLLEERLKEIKSEVKGFRPGHDQRLIAIALIINEVKKPDVKLTSLEAIENRIQALDPETLKGEISKIPPDIISNKVLGGILKKIEKEKNGPSDFFKEGISSESTSKKGQPSQYAQMKDRINDNLKPEKSTPSLK